MLTPDNSLPEIPQPKRISVVIVSLDRVGQLRQSLEMLGEAHQIVVVDNGSKDGAATLDAEFPYVRFNKLPRNFGTTRALNIGIRASEGEYILLLHDDARITGDAVTALADYLEAHSEAAAVCPLLSKPQARALPASANPDPPLVSATGVVECVDGAALMARAHFFRAMRNIDERYGAYGSAIEICAQIKSSGKKIVILDSVTAVHDAGVSPVRGSTLAGDRASGTAAFLTKHYGFGGSLAYRLKSLFSLQFAALSGQKIDGTS